MIVRELFHKLSFKTDLTKLKQFESKIKTATKSLKKFSKQTSDLGKALQMRFTLPVLGAGVLALKNFDQQAKAIAQIETALKSTGHAAKLTFGVLNKEAERLQSQTLFTDETILKDLTAQLLTFTNIKGEQFLETQIAAMDVATRVGQDLKSTAIQLGKALNDPVANLGALGRTGIQFSKDQKELIKDLAETNRLSEAQAIILKELQKQYGGSAKAAANVGLGPLVQVWNEFNDTLEEFGKIIVEEFIEPILPEIRKFGKFLRNLDGDTKKMIITFGLIVAVLGPALVIIGQVGLGISFLITSIGALKAALAFVAPFVLPFIALGLVLEDLNAHFNGAESVLGKFAATKSWDDVAENIRIITNQEGKLTELAGLWIKLYKVRFEGFITSVRLKYKEFLFYIKDMINGFLNSISQAISRVWSVLSKFTSPNVTAGFTSFEEIDGFSDFAVNAGGLGGQVPAFAGGFPTPQGDITNQFQSSPNITVNVGATANGQEIADVVKKEVQKENGKIFREAQRAGIGTYKQP